MITAYVMEDNNAIVPENELHSGPASIKVYSYIYLINNNNLFECSYNCNSTNARQNFIFLTNNI